MKILRVLLVLMGITSLLVASGCWNYKEMSNLYYITAVGIDWNRGAYDIYAQISDFSTVAGPEGEGNGDSTKRFWTVHGRGITLDAAAHDLYAHVDGYIRWGHVTVILLSERVLKHGFRDIIDLWNRFYENRYTPWVFATDESLTKILTNPPVVFDSPLNMQLQNPYSEYQQRSYIPPVRYFEWVRNIREPGRTQNIPGLRMVGEWMTHKGKRATMLEIDHIYNTHKHHMLAKMEASDLMGMRWITPQMIQSHLNLQKDGQSVADLIVKNPKVQITPYVGKNGYPRYDIDVDAEATIISLKKPLSLEKIKRLSQQTIADQIHFTQRQALSKRCDVYNLSYHFFYQNPKAWNQLNKKGKMILRTNSLGKIKVEVKITTSGKSKIHTMSKK
ncbi:Ger(x)C family spore germination protein [Desmospora activa]|uniref:Ger(X)C family germination protein n=1 Tax=Desmospora activa DSM 45169 TaxID=1121389 RepID=A0A2T4ZCG1_9BACL|nr:Ger(x)C family spore germination protein [Desmospora activa]PTM59573.1 Ger(x)C family germination protein [Desmospora activa DSM 45169]